MAQTKTANNLRILLAAEAGLEIFALDDVTYFDLPERLMTRDDSRIFAATFGLRIRTGAELSTYGKLTIRGQHSPHFVFVRFVSLPWKTLNDSVESFSTFSSRLDVRQIGVRMFT